VGRIERQVKNDAWAFWGVFLQLLFGFGVLAWPIVIIDFAIFGPVVTWWQWMLGGLAEAIWLPILIRLWMAYDTSKKSQPRRARRRY
jgi:hypothetical protein